jgi:hypothetical protein
VWAPEPVWTSWRRNVLPLPVIQPHLPTTTHVETPRTRQLEELTVLHFTFIFHMISVFSCFIYACLLLPTLPFCNSGCTKRTIFPWQRVLGTDPKENTSRLLFTDRCQVKVTLRPTTSRSVRLGFEPRLGLMTRC